MSSLQEINNAFLESFDAKEIARLTKFSLNIDIDDIAASSDLSDTIFRLTTWAYRDGRLAELVNAAKNTSGNPILKNLEAPTTSSVISSSGLLSRSSISELPVNNSDSEILTMRVNMLEKELRELKTAIRRDIEQIRSIVTGEDGDDGIRWLARMNGKKLDDVENMMRSHIWITRVGFTAITIAIIISLLR